MNGSVKITASWERMVGHLAAGGETPDEIAAAKYVLAHYPSAIRNGRSIAKGTAATGTLGQYVMYCPKGAIMVLILSGPELTAFLHENGTPAHVTLQVLMAARPGNPAVYGRATIDPIPDDTEEDRKYMVTIK